MLDLLKNSLNVKVLGEEQMLSVSGGGTCAAYWPDRTLANSGEACNYSAATVSGSGNTVTFQGMSMESAMCAAQAKPGGRWCCSSCGTASWL